MIWVSLVIVLALAEYLVFTLLVAQARGKYGVHAPAIAGHPVFERYLRVQQNTLEQLIVFIPAIWLFATYVNPRIAALLGVVFVASRALYAQAYIREPRTRLAGIASTLAVQVVLLGGALFGIARGLFQ
jgi:uncharacterized membrane protein YecN with MAPEG domain